MNRKDIIAYSIIIVVLASFFCFLYFVPVGRCSEVISDGWGSIIYLPKETNIGVFNVSEVEEVLNLSELTDTCQSCRYDLLNLKNDCFEQLCLDRLEYFEQLCLDKFNWECNLSSYNISRFTITIEEYILGGGDRDLYTSYPPKIKEATVAIYSYSSNHCSGDEYSVKINGKLKEVSKKKFERFIDQYKSECNDCLVTLNRGCC
jgi:hypothetical protein